MYINNIQSMSDPQNQSNNGIVPTPAPTILSYFNATNAVNEFRSEIPDMIIVFMVSFGISVYEGDDYALAAERAGVLSAAQYIGQYMSDALNNAQYFNSSSMFGQAMPVLTKFAVATGLFVGTHKFGLSSTVPVDVLFGESAIASVVSHYTSGFISGPVNNAISDAENLPTY
jgi:hypothetical protein